MKFIKKNRGTDNRDLLTFGVLWCLTIQLVTSLGTWLPSIALLHPTSVSSVVFPSRSASDWMIHLTSFCFPPAWKEIKREHQEWFVSKVETWYVSDQLLVCFLRFHERWSFCPLQGSRGYWRKYIAGVIFISHFLLGNRESGLAQARGLPPQNNSNRGKNREQATCLRRWQAKNHSQQKMWGNIEVIQWIGINFHL